MRVLIIEDEARLAENVARSLRESAGYAVDVSLDGEEGAFMAESNPYDLVILDLMLPKLDGLAVLQRMRNGGSAVPVLVLTARDEKESIVALLNAGADDYISQAVRPGRAAGTRQSPDPARQGTECGGIKGRRSGDQYSRSHGAPQRKTVTLTAMEYRVLEYLAHRPGAVVPKTELLEHLYDFNWERFSNVIEVYVSGLRRKLDDGGDSKLIHTLRGQGYMLRG